MFCAFLRSHRLTVRTQRGTLTVTDSTEGSKSRENEMRWGDKLVNSGRT